MFAPVKIGVVGLGRFGRLHALTAAKLVEAQLVGLVARRQASLDAIAKELPGVPGWTSFEQAIAESQAEAWIVACSTPEHVRVTKALLIAGKTVLLEKPISESLEEAQSLAPLVRPNSSNLMLGHIVLFNSEFQQLREEAARRGRLSFIDCVRHRPATIVKQFPGENPLHAAMVHDLYAVQALLGSREPDHFSAQYHRTTAGEIDLALAQLAWRDGPLTSFAASYLTPAGMPPRGFDRMEVFGEGWSARICPNPRPIDVWDSQASWPLPLEIRAAETGATGMMAEEQRCFCRVVRGEQAVPAGATYADALQVQTWMDKLGEAAMKSVCQMMILLLAWSLVGGIKRTSADELSKLAVSMKAGTWAELETKGYDAELLKVQNHHILEYTDTAVWDPGSEQVLFVGQGHYSAVKFVAYSAATNSWKLMPTPEWWNGDPATGKGPIGHAYNNNAIDAVKGVLFHHQSATRLVHRYAISKGEWTTLPEIKDAAVGHGTALVYFPERKGLVRVLAGTVHFYDEEKNTWSVVTEKLPMGPYHNLAKYNPVERTVILGAGNDSKLLHRLDADGNYTKLKEAPFTLRISSTVVSIDPVSGNVLVLGMDDKHKFHVLDLKKNDWRQMPDAPLAEGVAAPIAAHGVTMYFANRPTKVFLYKHAERE